MVGYFFLDACFFPAQADDIADEFLWYQYGRADDGFAGFQDSGRIRHFGRILDKQHFIRKNHFVYYRGRGGDEMHAILTLKTFLDDLHVQHAEETAAETKAKRLGS